MIDKDGDTDYFSFPATKGQVLDINVYARRLRSPLDPVLHVARKGGAYVAGADDSAGPDSTLRFTAPEDGDYVVYLHDHLTKGSPESFYRIELTPVAPKTVVSVTTEQIPIGTGAIAAAVPSRQSSGPARHRQPRRLGWRPERRDSWPALRRHGRARRHGRQSARRARALERAAADAPFRRHLAHAPRQARRPQPRRPPAPNFRPPACWSWVPIT